jgi:hypothetical protein
MARYGEIKRNRRRALKTLFRNRLTGARKAAIHLDVYRTHEKGGPYGAEACMRSRGSWLRQNSRSHGVQWRAYQRKYERCNVGRGNTPTKAVKRAVTGLMKKIH